MADKQLVPHEFDLNETPEDEDKDKALVPVLPKEIAVVPPKELARVPTKELARILPKKLAPRSSWDAASLSCCLYE